MRKIVCSVFALCCCSLVLAQEKTRSLSVELLGAQNVVGINYDSRFMIAVSRATRAGATEWA